MEVIFIYMIHSYFDHKRLGKIIKKCALASHNTYFFITFVQLLGPSFSNRNQFCYFFLSAISCGLVAK